MVQTMGILKRAWNILRSRFSSDSPKDSGKSVDELYEKMCQAEKDSEGGNNGDTAEITFLLWPEDILGCFKTLQMKPTDDLQKICVQWKTLQKGCHPDLNPAGTAECSRINAAYAQIKEFLANKRKAKEKKQGL